MDIKELKEKVRKYIAAIADDGKKFSFVALIQANPGVSDTSYILQVQADWIEKKQYKKFLDYMVPKMFEVLEQPTRQFISRINVYDKKWRFVLQV